MNKQIPIKIDNELELLELMGRYDITKKTLAEEGAKVLAHCFKQTNSLKKATVTVLLYLNTSKKKVKP